MKTKTKKSPSKHQEKVKKAVRLSATIVIALAVLCAVVFAEIWFKKVRDQRDLASWQPYINQNYNIQLSYPADWSYRYESVADDNPEQIQTIIQLYPREVIKRIQDNEDICSKTPFESIECLAEPLELTIFKNFAGQSLADWVQNSNADPIGQKSTKVGGGDAFSYRVPAMGGEAQVTAFASGGFFYTLTDYATSSANNWVRRNIYSDILKNIGFLNSNN